MARKRVLITGGAGFIGSHLSDELLARGYRVRVLDSLAPQVHGEARARPDHLARDVELLRGDIRDRRAVGRSLKAVDLVVHLAAAVGVGLRMDALARCASVDRVGTAVLLEAIGRTSIEKLVVASSMGVYGEGLYRTPEGTLVEAPERSLGQLQAGQWEPTGPGGEPLEPVPTPETKAATATSVSALGKHDQERLCLMVGRARGLPTVALRFFNVYGPRQSLASGDAGVLAVFASQLLAGRAPVVFEDGLQQRDFVNVHDVARACRMALESPAAGGRVFNVGSGSSMNVRTVAAQLAEALGRRHLRPQLTGQYRVGDVRHCIADTTLAAKTLGFEARRSFTEGLLELAEWLGRQRGSGAARPEMRGIWA